MSGLKISVFEVIAAVATILILQRKAKIKQAELEALIRQLKETIESIPAELKPALQNQIRAAEAWIASANNMLQNSSPNLLQLDAEQLESIEEALNQAIETGQTLQRELLIITAHESDRASAELEFTAQTLQQQFDANRSLIEKWVGEKAIQEMNASIANVKMFIQRRDLTSAKRALQTLQTSLQNLISLSNELEDKHQKRLYLLKALREVCAELGFQEIKPPFYEQENNPKSRIVYQVDTLDQGQIVFYIGMDEVSSNSEIVESKCISEFEQISESLKKRFGVLTAFKRIDTSSPPKLIQKGELEEPTGTDATAGASAGT